MVRKFGWKPSLPQKSKKYETHFPFTLSLAADPLPALVDLSSSCSPIEDQGSHGTCVGHGTCAHLEFLEIAALKAQQKSVPEIFEPAFNPISRLFVYANARLIDGTPLADDNGTAISSAIEGIKTKGICRESLWPYLDDLVTLLPGHTAYSEGIKHQVIDDYQVNHLDILEIKQCLSSGYPIIFGITCYDSMMKAQVAKSGSIPMPSEGDQIVGGHCMLLVGYDDGIKKFKIRNSWGTSWGVGGYGSIDYSYLTSSDLASDFWTLRLQPE